MVSELLDMLHKTEQSLARVRKNKPADLSAAAGSSEISNIQKISLQLLLDIKVLPNGVLAGMYALSLTLVYVLVPMHILDSWFAVMAVVHVLVDSVECCVCATFLEYSACHSCPYHSMLLEQHPAWVKM